VRCVARNRHRREPESPFASDVICLLFDLPIPPRCSRVICRVIFGVSCIRAISIVTRFIRGRDSQSESCRNQFGIPRFAGERPRSTRRVAKTTSSNISSDRSVSVPAMRSLFCKPRERCVNVGVQFREASRREALECRTLRRHFQIALSRSDA